MTPVSVPVALVVIGAVLVAGILIATV